METKKWYFSKRVWSVVMLVISATVTLFAHPGVHVVSAEVAVAVNQYILTIASGLGIAALLSPQTPIG